MDFRWPSVPRGERSTTPRHQLSAIHPHSLLQRALPGSETSDREHRQQRVSKRLTDGTAACLRARYCANLAWFDLARMDRRNETSGATDPLQIKNQYRYV